MNVEEFLYNKQAELEEQQKSFSRYKSKLLEEKNKFLRILKLVNIKLHNIEVNSVIETSALFAEIDKPIEEVAKKFIGFETSRRYVFKFGDVKIILHPYITGSTRIIYEW